LYYVYYSGAVPRDWGWTERGRASATRNAVPLTEVIDALYAERQLDNEVGTEMLVVCGEAATGRLITVLAERLSPTVAIYKIVYVRPASEAEHDEWRRRYS